MEQQENTPARLRITEAAAYLNISPDQMRRLGDVGIIPMTRTLGIKGAGHRQFDQRVLDTVRVLMRNGASHEQIQEHFYQAARREMTANG